MTRQGVLRAVTSEEPGFSFTSSFLGRRAGAVLLLLLLLLLLVSERSSEHRVILWPER